MSRIRTISNPNILIEEKINYFIDKFNHFIQYGNQNLNLELENHSSIIEKTLSILSQNNLENAIPYLDNLLAHELFKDTGTFEKYSSYEDAKHYINNYQSNKGGNKKSILRNKKITLNNPNFRESIEFLSKELNEKYPALLIENLNRVILCPASLEEHNHKSILNELARYFVSEAFFTGKNKSEILESINRIFKKDINDFPFPKEVEESNRESFIQENNLLNQLIGFKSLLEEDPIEGIVLMKAYTICDFPKDFEFEYNGVIFLSLKSKKIKEIKKQITNSPSRQYFSGKNNIIVAKKLTWYSTRYIHKRFQNSTNTQLEYVSAILKRKISIDRYSNYIILNNDWKFQGIQTWNIDQNTKFPMDGLKNLKNNPFNILLNSTSKGKEEFLNFEPIFINAHTNGLIYKFWSYLECIIPLDENGKKQVKFLVSKILLLSEEPLIKRRIIETLDNSFSFLNGGYSKLDIDIPEWKEIMEKIKFGEIPEKIRKFNYPFISELIEEYDTELDQMYYQKAYNFYFSLLTEAYSIRNSDIHSGLIQNKSNIKIGISMPIIVWRLRWMIMDGIMENPTFDLKEVIENLAFKGQKLLEE